MTRLEFTALRRGRPLLEHGLWVRSANADRGEPLRGRPFILCMASCGDRDAGRHRVGHKQRVGVGGKGGGGGRALRRWYRKHVGSRIMSWAFGVARKAAAVLPRSRRLRAVSTISEPRVLGLPTCAARAGRVGVVSRD